MRELLCYVLPHKSKGRFLWYICDRCGTYAPHDIKKPGKPRFDGKIITRWRGGFR